MTELTELTVPDATAYESLFGSLTGEDLQRVAIVEGGSGAELTSGELRDRVDAFAGWLAARGVVPGDVVGLIAPNGPGFAIAFHGILRAGATATTLNALYTAEEITNQLADAGAVALVTVSPLLERARSAAERLGIPAERLVVLDGAEGHPSLADVLEEGSRAPDVDLDPATHLAVLPYSSGTTGHPKGMMLTHRNLVANVTQCGAIGVEGDDVVLAVLPFFHIYGMTVLLNYALRRRARLVTTARFDLAEFLRLIEEHRITWLFIAPPIAVALAKHPAVDGVDTSSVKAVFSGAAPLDRHLADAVADRLGCAVAQGYGMTETSPVTHVTDWTDPDVDRASVGRPVAGTEVRLVAPGGADVEPPTSGPSEPGEVWIHGPQVMVGYLGRPEETAATLDAYGWLHTGDLATVDDAGVYCIVDRLKELIKYHGYQVAPAVLEAVLLEHPQVADAAVIGGRDEDGQEIPQAFVVRRGGQRGDRGAGDGVRRRAGRAAREGARRRVHRRRAKSASGKILRRELRTPATP